MTRLNTYYSNRIPELDMLRGAAILLVLLRHYPVLPGFRQCWIGVDIFFTLSGFLVAGLLIRENRKRGTVGIGRFLIRRGLKIYPSFYVFLLLTVGLAAAMKLAGKPIFFPVLSWERFGVELIYLQSLMGGLWWHTWSLAVEEHFYFLLALLVFVFTIRAFRRIGLVGGLTVVSMISLPVCTYLRFRAADIHPEFSYLIHYNNTFLRLDSLFFGVLIACMFYGQRRMMEKVPVAAWYGSVAFGLIAVISWLSVFPLESLATARLGFSVIYIGFGLIMAGLLGVRMHSDWSDRPGVQGNPVARMLLFMGRNSYNIYLWHALVLETLILSVYSLLGKSVFDPMTFPYFIPYFAGSILLGALATKYIELPILQWRDRRFKRPAGLLVGDDRNE